MFKLWENVYYAVQKFLSTKCHTQVKLELIFPFAHFLFKEYDIIQFKDFIENKTWFETVQDVCRYLHVVCINLAP